MKSPLVRTARLMALCAAIAWPTAAAADHKPTDFSSTEWSDPSAVALIYLPALVTGALSLWANPPRQPRLFSPREGRARSRVGAEIPNWWLHVATGASVAALATFGGDERWFHAKGFAQAWATTKLITGVTKNVFGRRRPDWRPDSKGPDPRRSFISGHSSSAAMHATYLALYAYKHGPSSGLQRAAIIGGLAVYGAYVPYTRTRDNRHHPSDVVAGAAVGAAVAATFFFLNDSRFQDSKHSASSIAVSVPF